MKKISFVIPCYRSENTIMSVVDEIREKVGEKAEYDYEVITVNDCSPDNVWSVLVKEAETDRKVKPISFSKNMGQVNAIMAGLRHSSGDSVVVLDDDGQCPMNNLWELIEPLNNGQDVSIAAYNTRKQSAFKDFGTWFNETMTHIVLKRPKDLQFTNFMALKKNIVNEIVKYENPYPYMTGLILRTTNKIVNVPMEERSRLEGGTTYSLGKLISLWLNGMTAFSVLPLRIATFFGSFCAIIGFIFGLVTIIRKFVNPNIAAGYSSTISIILFVGGVIMVMLGMIGEYVGRIYISINNSPQYTISEKINYDED